MKCTLKNHLPEISLTLATMGLALFLTHRAGVPFNFCLPGIIAIMAEPLFFFCLPGISLFILSMRCVKEYRKKRGGNPDRLLSIIKGEIGAVFLTGEMVISVSTFFFLLFLMGVFYVGISNIKPLVPLYNPFIFDKLLLQADTNLLGGFDWTGWLAQFHTPWLNTLMNALYLSLFPLFGVTMVVLFLSKDIISMRRLILCLMILTLIGNLWHFLMPSLGDVYIHPERYSDITGVYVRVIQRYLMTKQLELMRVPASFQTAPFIGIAAIPSLHIAKFLIYIRVIKEYSKLFLMCYLFIFIGLFISTLYFGWHYIVDNIAGILIAIIVYNFVFSRIKRTAPALST